MQYALWTYIRSSQRWIEFQRFNNRIDAVDFLRKRNATQFDRDDDGYPIWYIKNANGFPPVMPEMANP